MKITKNKKYTQINPSQGSVSDFFTNFENDYDKFVNQHLIIDFSEKFNIKIEEISLFLKLSVLHQENGTSFVVICSTVDIDDLPDEMNVVPTFEEAIDILEMDAIERDLGF